MTEDQLAIEKENELLSKLKADLPIDSELEGNSRIYIERPLPYLTYCRLASTKTKSVPAALLKSQPAFVWDCQASEAIADFLSVAISVLYKRFGAFIFFELDECKGEQAIIEYTQGPGKSAFVAKLEEEIKPLFEVKCVALEVEELTHLPNYFSDTEGLMYVRLKLPKSAYQQTNGQLYPMRFRYIHRELDTALRKAFFDFVRLQTRQPTAHYHALGRQQPGTLVWEIDQKLTEISQQFDFLLLTSVLNHEGAWEQFKKHNYQQQPDFRYRLIPLDPDKVKRELYNLPIEKVEDPTLSYILRDKRTELDKMLNMLLERGTANFKLSSVQVFGEIESWLLAEAEEILEKFPDAGPSISQSEEIVDAITFAEMGRSEIAFLKEQYEAVDAQVEVRTDISGLMVSNGKLLIGSTYKTSRRRAEALLQHEVGTHVLTFFNGKAQPLQILKTGTPGYEDLQEGLAVLAEYFSGGLTMGRLRTLAARVVAVNCMVHGGSFPECFALLHSQYNFTPKTAYKIVERVYRGGGMTKDAVYLRGLVCLLNHLEQGHDLSGLLIGKIQQSYFPFIQELLERKILVLPPIMPRYMQAPDYQNKLKILRTKTKVADLLSVN